ncbi:SusC/RagA family TonB-linked outer membrane protein [Flavobacterium daejeonense]|uniref:SusC/RagA family TonB-linked outer membrane protein n=1 Tax=Flavobacterium daejeonense TaxID=350893 RepID=UPI00047B2B3D|nr:SusC/RagA family TonB-linked outer membrane protein [Flavobacterium daejeonense]
MKQFIYYFELIKKSSFFGKKLWTLIFIFVFFSSFSQQRIKGTIKDGADFPIPGVTVMEKGTKNSVVSDLDGNYEIISMTSHPTLIFSYVGQETKEIAVDGRSIVNVVMKDAVSDLSEVVVIGYGTQKKGDVTSSIATVKSKNFAAGSVRNASELIRGKVAGLSITNGSGDPSASSSVSLRGVASLQGNTAPLVLINGVPGGFDSIAPEDIESIDVLKDASAAAIYGTRGANGVILITTKTVGRDVPTTITYSHYTAFSSFGKKANFLDAGQLRELRENNTFPLIVKNSLNADLGFDTDWLGEITRKAFTQNHTIGMKGGNVKSNYVASVSYMEQEGVFKGSDNNEFKISLDVNHFMFNDKLKVNLNLVNGIQNINAAFNPRVYRQALIRNPTDRVKKEDGTWQERSIFQYENPLALIEETESLNQNKWMRLTGNTTLTLLPGWDTSLNLSTLRSMGLNGYAESKQHISNTRDNRNGYASRSTYNDKTDLLEFTTKYSEKLDKHRVSALAGYSYQYIVREGFNANNSDFPTDAFSYNNLGAGRKVIEGQRGLVGSYKNDEKLIGFFGRVSYGYDNKYNILMSLRQEGSSKFGKNNKWGTFPSVSAGWTISNESFMKDLSFIDNLKLRSGFGVTGITPGASYLSQTLYNYAGDIYSDGKWVQGLVPASNPNPDLKWEKSSEFNIGLDFSFLKNRISGSVDVYNKQTKDLLWDYSVPTPPNLYGSTLANVGKLENKGIEVLLNVNPIKLSNFSWDSNLTFAYNKNKLLSLSNDLYEIDGDYINTGGVGDPISMSTHRLEVGQPVGNIWGLKTVDITDGGTWIIETKDGTRKTLEPNLYTDENKQYLGNGRPAYNVGWANTFKYKQFDLNVALIGSFDFQIINQQRMFYEVPKAVYNKLDSAYDLVYGKSLLTYDQTFVSYYVEKGDYVKLDNVTLAYNLDVKKLKFINSAKIYASGSNIATITGYKGQDPEVTSEAITPGNDDRDKFPTIRTFTLGINLTF